jgi:hypothetical protein
VGVPAANPGYVQTVSGRLSGTKLLSAVVLDTLWGEATGDAFGSSLVAADVDGDGVTDAVVGAPGVDGTAGDDGAVYVFAGGTSWSGNAAGADVSFVPTCASCGVGDAVPVVADFDGDGTPDLAFGSPVVGTGGVWVVSGTLTGARRNADADALTRIPEPGEQLGAALAAVDLDADGLPELAVGAPAAGSGSGALYVFAGPLPAGTVATGSAAATFSASTSTGFGTTLAALSDVDGDGLPELAVGAPEDGTGGSAAGGVWVFTGGGY